MAERPFDMRQVAGSIPAAPTTSLDAGNVVGSPMANVRIKYVYRDRSRHGQVRLYFWRGAGTAKIRLTETEGSAEFHARVASLTRETEIAPILPAQAATASGPTHGTFGALVHAYMASAAFHDYDAATVKKRRNLFGNMLDERVTPEQVTPLFRDMPLASCTAANVEVLRDRAQQRDTVGQANERVKALRAMFRWAMTKTQRPRWPMLQHNPASDLTTITAASEGWHTWTLAEIEQFERRHPPGTRAWLVLQVALYTGARRSDLIRIGRPHVHGDMLRFNQQKGRRRHTTTIEFPILQPLAEALARGPVGEVTWITNDQGRPFVYAVFGNWFKERCAEAGLAHCSLHGLRKAAATRAAENGATASQLMAIFGWRKLAQAEQYTKAAERRKMAKAGMQTLLLRKG